MFFGVREKGTNGLKLLKMFNTLFNSPKGNLFYTDLILQFLVILNKTFEC